MLNKNNISFKLSRLELARFL